VIIPTVGRWESISAVLSDLADLDGLELEIIVIGDGLPLTEMQDELAARLPPLPNMIVLSLPTKSGVAAARNTGIAAATMPTLVFLDDDIRLGPRWGEALCSILDAGWMCSTGPVTSDEKSLLARAREDRYLRRYAGLKAGDSVDFFAGGNGVIAGRLLRDIGGFPPVRTGSDTAVLQQLAHHGVNCQFEPRLAVIHTHDRGWRTALAVAWGAGSQADRSRLRAETWSLLRSLPTRGAVGMVNAALLSAKVGGFVLRRSRSAR
jgi:glycosyltransferase involved in cell wall biosynthesis